MGEMGRHVPGGVGEKLSQGVVKPSATIRQALSS